MVASTRVQQEYPRWIKGNVEAKSVIKLTLSDGPLGQISIMVDDIERSAKDLVTKLDNVFLMYITKIVEMIARELETMQFIKERELNTCREVSFSRVQALFCR